MVKIIKVESFEAKTEIIEFLRSGTYPNDLSKLQKQRFRNKASSFVLVNNTLCFKKPNGELLKAVFDF